MRNLYLAVWWVPLLLALTGCGGGKRGATSVTPRGIVQVGVKWPASSRLIPIATKRIHLIFRQSISGTPQLIGSYDIDAPNVSESTTTVTDIPLPIGTFTAMAKALDTSGHILALGESSSFTTSLGATASFSVEMTSAPSHLEITGPNAMEIGEAGVFGIHAEDAHGSTVLVPPSSLVWSSSNPGRLRFSDSISGQAMAVGEGDSIVTVSDQDVDKSASADVATYSTDGKPLYRFVMGPLIHRWGSVQKPPTYFTVLLTVDNPIEPNSRVRLGWEPFSVGPPSWEAIFSDGINTYKASSKALNGGAGIGGGLYNFDLLTSGNGDLANFVISYATSDRTPVLGIGCGNQDYTEAPTPVAEVIWYETSSGPSPDVEYDCIDSDLVRHPKWFWSRLR